METSYGESMESTGSLQTPLPLQALESIYPFLGKPPPSGGLVIPTLVDAGQLAPNCLVLLFTQGQKPGIISAP